MADAKTPRVLDDAGPAAPPRRNGELVFEHVWQGRLFGLTMALYDAGAFVWDEFRDRLIEEITAWECEHPGSEDHAYYDRWLAAFERLVIEKGMCGSQDLRQCFLALEARPPGHDHG